MKLTFVNEFLIEAARSIAALDAEAIGDLVRTIRTTRDVGGRLFILGNGGGAGHASHAVADFRKLAGVEAYSFDCLSELTARVNDEGWDRAYVDWLKASQFIAPDCLLVISVGGGNAEQGVSVNLCNAMEYAMLQQQGRLLAIVGRDGGRAAQLSHGCVRIPADRRWTTPIVESIQSLVLHLIVTHPELAVARPVWEERCDG